MKFKKAIILLLLLLLTPFAFNRSLLAEDNNQENNEVAEQNEKLDELRKKIEEYEKKIKQLKGEQQTLSSAIAYLDSQINLTSAQIAATEQELEILAEEISKLDVKIDILDESLEEVSEILSLRIKETYKRSLVNPFYLIISSPDFTDAFSRVKYLKIVQAHDRELLQQMQKSKMNYDSQKDVKEEKQEEEEALKAQLQSQQMILAQQKEQKNELLEVTKNDEQKFQDLLAKAKSEVASLRSYVVSQGGDICLGSSPSQPDGWFWSQRDPKWCKQKIGNSDENIGSVGCLVSSVAMIWQKHGSSTTPAQIASNIDYFFYDTAYMINPPPVSNYLYIDGYDEDLIDEKLALGQPVIVHFNLGGDGHWVVIKSGSDGNYVINDPWHGADLKLDDYYSVYSIDQGFTFRP